MSQIVVGSISMVAEQAGKSIAETFMDVDAIVIVDTSGSMSAQDSRGGQKRYDVACKELAELQASLPGKVAVIGFSNEPIFHPGGVPFYQGGGTDMAKALKFARVADIKPGIKFFMVSDGQPNNAQETLEVAKSYKNKIHTIYVGPETDREAQEFLVKLASMTGGKYAEVGHKVMELSKGIQQLLHA